MSKRGFTTTFSSPRSSALANSIQIAGGGTAAGAYVENRRQDTKQANEKHPSESRKRHKANKGSH